MMMNRVGIVKLLTKKFQFCEESVKVNKPCPVTAGEQTLETTVDLPKEIPIVSFCVLNREKTQGHSPNLYSISYERLFGYE
jgi:hypothetical protein